MTSPERNREKYEDALFSILMQNAMDAEGSALHIHNKTYSQDEVHAVSPETDARCHAAIERGFEERARRKKKRTYKKIFRTLLIAVLVSTLLFTTVCATVPEVRWELSKVVTNISTKLFFGTQVPSQTSSDYSFYYIPEGYLLSEELYYPDEELYIYSNGEKELMIKITCDASYRTVSIDTEDAHEVSEVEMGAFTGILVCKGDRVHLVVEDTDHDNMLQIITHQLKKQEALTMLENIHYIGP